MACIMTKREVYNEVDKKIVDLIFTHYNALYLAVFIFKGRGNGKYINLHNKHLLLLRYG